MTAGELVAAGELMTARAEVSALDDHLVAVALDGLVNSLGYWGHEGALAGIERTGRYLAGTWNPTTPDEGPGMAGKGSWTQFMGRIGAVAVPRWSPRAMSGADGCSRCCGSGRKAPSPLRGSRIRTGVVRTAGDRATRWTLGCVKWICPLC
ncbi:hypothetical protein NGF19_15390 [Streptomyces sp. RY43-2]|uniref:Uncharacterized protein n=1 Tax=Streptomyces macrolidinus TaxID=2952607 RepID=A0ABT0ZF15_9ACTN|nr:hypothetical protein [Streptomyces macrolidinus]MCN9242157.1 hypothetical protein [Streptomyces macrolidinus]